MGDHSQIHKPCCPEETSSRQSHGHPSLQQGSCCGGEHQFLYFSDSMKEFWIFCVSYEGKEWELPNWLSFHISNRSWTVHIPGRVLTWMLPYEFMIIQDWELNKAKFVHIDLKPCYPNITNAQSSNNSDKVWRFPFTWQVHYIPSTGQLRMLDSEMIKIISHHSKIHYPSLWYFYWLIGIVNTHA